MRRFAAYGKTVGMEVKPILVDPGSMDATSVILEAMSFKPDAIDFNTPKEMGIPLYAAAERQDLGGKVCTNGGLAGAGSSIG
jgi:branched-chain amino acid transport system substrate-binding protein